MRYATAAALRAALDQRLVAEANTSGTDIARLRRRVAFERLLVRFALVDGERWVLKDGAAVEVRMADRARRPDVRPRRDRRGRIVAVDLSQHFAEKLHALVREYGDRPSSRVKDLADLILFIDGGLEPRRDLVTAVGDVFIARGSAGAPVELPDPPRRGRHATPSWLPTFSCPPRTLQPPCPLSGPSGRRPLIQNRDESLHSAARAIPSGWTDAGQWRITPHLG